MIIENKDKNQSTTGFVIRLLNSPLRGCEFPLALGRTLFIVSNESELINFDLVPELPLDTIYIPLDEGGVNFEIIVNKDADVDEDKILLSELSESDSSIDHTIYFNTPMKIGELSIAIRPENEEWSSEVLSEKEQKDNLKRIPKKCSFKLLRKVAFCSVIAVGIFVATYWIWNAPQRQVAELNSLLGVEKQHFQVLLGRDNIFYIVAKDERRHLWARQVIARGGYEKEALVVDNENENKRLTEWLSNNYPAMPFYRLHLNNPKKPQFWISRQRTSLDPEQRKKLIAELMKVFPYAESIDIVSIDDNVAISQAENGLKLQALPYTINKGAQNFTFLIKGSLDDGEILRTRQFINEYTQKWGNNYVQFAIELKDDWLKGRSFQYGSEGYIKKNSSHWYYPSPL
ncbi:TPA: PrgH/EprH family type III secretion apparatus protein [Providencia rettgeri]